MAPRLRTDLIATTADDQGVMCVEVTDPLTSTSFRFYDFEYALAQQLTGQPLEAVVAWASETFGVELSAETLDQFIEKLAGLGFLVGGSSGAQPAVFAPFSPSTISQPLHGVPTFDDVPSPTAADAPPTEPIPHDSGRPVFTDAMAPEALSSGDATEYRLRDTAADSGLWQRGGSGGDLAQENGQGRHRQDEAAPSQRAAATDKGVRPRLEALGGPLPPISGPGDQPAPVAAAPATGSERKSPDHPAASSVDDADAESQGQSPLASIAHVIMAESSGQAPVGALDRGGINMPTSSAAAPARDARVPGRSGPAWAKDLVQQVDQPPADRRQPPRPEVVVMPPVAEPPPPVAAPRGRTATLVVVLLLLLAGAGAVFWFFNRPAAPGASPSGSLAAPVPVVHVASPQPTTFYRWFETAGVVIPGRDDTLSFLAGGRLQDAMPPGTTFAAGETIARLQGVAARELIVNRARSHVSYYEQLRDSSRAEGAEATARQAEAKLAARKQELAAAQGVLRQLEIHPKVGGEIAELLVAKGMFVRPGQPVFRVRASGPRATFTMSAEDVARARALGFCRVETIPGAAGGGTAAGAGGAAGATSPRPIDCSLAAGGGGGGTRLAVDLTGAAGLAPGTQVRLASARYDAVFPVPHTALSQKGGEDHLWILAGAGKIAESRVVQVAATVDDLGLIAHGLAVGDAVIVDPPADLQSGVEVNVVR